VSGLPLPIAAPMRSLAILLLAIGCTSAKPSVADGNAGVDSLNARLSKAYRDHDPVAYGRLFTDSATFEWPAFETVRGRTALEAMARTNWTSLTNMDLKLDVAQRRIAPDHVTEFGAFQQAYTDTSGRHVEYGRYVAVLVPAADGWRMDRFFGFSDSTAKR